MTANRRAHMSGASLLLCGSSRPHDFRSSSAASEIESFSQLQELDVCTQGDSFVFGVGCVQISWSSAVTGVACNGLIYRPKPSLFLSKTVKSYRFVWI